MGGKVGREQARRPVVRCSYCGGVYKGRGSGETVMPYRHKTWLEQGENPEGSNFTRHLPCPGTYKYAEQVGGNS